MRRILLSLILVLLTVLPTTAQAPDESQIAEARRRVAGPPSATELPDLVSVPLVGSKTLPLVEIKINGRGPYRLLVDTAANVTLLKMRVADELKLKVLRPGDTSKLVAINTIEIGRARFRDVVAGARSWDENIDGVIGFNLFADVMMTLDYPRQRLELKKGILPEPNGRYIFKYGLDNRCPTLDVVIGRETMTMLIDTGAGQAVALSEKDAAKLAFKNALTAGPELSTFQTAKSRARVGILAGSISFGRIAIREPAVHVWGEEPPLIGSALFEDLLVTFDQKHQRVRISPK